MRGPSILRILTFAAAVLASARAFGQGEAPTLPAEFEFSYVETRPNDARLEFRIEKGWQVAYRWEQKVGADPFVAEGKLELKPALALRLVGALRGEFSGEYSEGLLIPPFWTMDEGGGASAPAQRVVIRARESARERQVTIPWSSVCTAADNKARDLPLSYLRLRLLQVSGVAGAVARAFREKGAAIMRENEAKLKTLEPAALEKKLQEGLCESEEEPYAMAQLWFSRAVEVLDRTYNMGGDAEDDSEQVLRVRYPSAFEAKHFRLAAQVVGTVLRDRLAWYDAALEKCGRKDEAGGQGGK